MKRVLLSLASTIAFAVTVNAQSVTPDSSTNYSGNIMTSGDFTLTPIDSDDHSGYYRPGEPNPPPYYDGDRGGYRPPYDRGGYRRPPYDRDRDYDRDHGGYYPRPPHHHPRSFTVNCNSGSYRYTECGVPGYIRNAYVAKQISRSACTYGYSWGYSSNIIWVDHGCRADIVVEVVD